MNSIDAKKDRVRLPFGKYSVEEKTLVLLFLFVFFCTTLTLAFLSTGTYESGDSIQHFLISKYAFKHPNLFLDHWGKPFFTLLSSPFSQFGFIGICIFNILCATLTGYISYLIAKKLELKFTWLAPLFALMAPIYYVTLISGLTEPLFGLILMFSIYLYISEKYLLGSILVSLLPFVRSEGFLLLPLFGIALLLKRSFKNIPLLGVGTLLYSIAGFFVFNDLLWIIHDNPYKSAIDIYGSGTLFHFVGKNEFILGTPLVILFLIGCTSFFKSPRTSNLELRTLLLGSILIYLIFHSIAWQQGIFGSLGLIRVMAGVTPLAGIIALKGLGSVRVVFEKYIKIKMAFTFFCLLLIIATLIMPFKQHSFPRKLDYEEVVVKQAADWVNENNLQGNKQYYMYPYYSVFMNIDPFDNSKAGLLYEIADITKTDDIIIWDNHFGPNEGKMSLKNLANPSFEIIAHFAGDRSITPSNKEVLEIYIFRIIEGNNIPRIVL